MPTTSTTSETLDWVDESLAADRAHAGEALAVLSARSRTAHREQDARGWGAIFSSAPFATGDESRNNAVLAVFTLGEGWHHHHASPSSARHGLKWWELDLAYAATRALAFAGLVSQVRTPAEFELSETAARSGGEGAPR